MLQKTSDDLIDLPLASEAGDLQALREKTWSNFLLRWIDAVEQAGGSSEKIAEAANLDVRRLRVHRPGISRAQFLAAMQCLINDNEDAALALRVGLEHKLLDNVVFGYAILSAPDIKECLNLSARLSAMLDSSFWQPDVIAYRDEKVWLYAIPNGVDEKQQLFSDHAWLGLKLAVIKELVGPGWQNYIDSIDLKGNDRSVTALLAKEVGGSVEPGCHRSAIYCSLDILELVNPHANDRIHQLGVNLCGELESHFKFKTSYAEQTERFLRACSHVSINESTVAQHLCISERSLRRSLKAQGLSFSELRNRALLESAIEFLTKTRLSIAEIAYRLGYAEATSFTRAFRRWSGMCPKTFRLQHEEA